MAFAIDAHTVALYDLSTGGTNLQGAAAWNLSPVFGGGWKVDAALIHWITMANDWTIERELVIPAASTGGTIIEYGAWGETEATNIQAVIGWDAERRLFVGWESGAGIDTMLRADTPLPPETPLRIAVTRFGRRAWIAVNGRMLVDADGLPVPTGGGIGNVPTPGMALYVGRRVTTSDPKLFTGGGWLRISEPRTFAEVQAEWTATLATPEPVARTFDELERAPAVRDYWVVRGTINAEGQSVPFAWSTVGVVGPLGFIEPRLVEPPAAFTVGLPAAVGVPPERVTTSIRVRNHDGALDQFLTGGPTPQTEYTGPSLYGIECQVYEGYIDELGAAVERAWTPTLVLDGEIEHADGVISFGLASKDQAILGRSHRLVTAQQIRDADFVAGSCVGWGYDVGLVGDDIWRAARDGWVEGLDRVVPWAYGRALIPLERMSGDAAETQFVACLTSEETNVRLTNWTVCGQKGGVVERIPQIGEGATNRGIASYIVRVQLTDDLGAPFAAWVIGCTTSTGARDYERLWIVPGPTTLLGALEGEPMTAPDVLRTVVQDHAEMGGAAIDAASFDAAAVALADTSGMIGGIYGDGATIADLITHIAQPVGLGLYFGPGDKLHALLPGSWGTADAEVAAGSLPALTDAEVFPAAQGASSWSEVAPSDPEDLGAPATWVTLQWDGDQRTVWPSEERRDRASAAKRVDVRTEMELRLSGAWVHPPASVNVIGSYVGARSFATRQVHATVPTWIARQGAGSLIRARHGQGLGYDGAPLRLLRATVMPAERAATCTWLDVSALEAMLVGVLDSEAHWVLYDPAGNGGVLKFNKGEVKAILDKPLASAGWIGASLWTFGSSVPELRRSWRIKDVVSSTEIVLDLDAPVAGELEAADPALPHLAPWIVMHNHDTRGATFRADKIRACDELAQVFSSGDPGYQYSQG